MNPERLAALEKSMPPDILRAVNELAMALLKVGTQRARWQAAIADGRRREEHQKQKQERVEADEKLEELYATIARYVVVTDPDSDAAAKCLPSLLSAFALDGEEPPPFHTTCEPEDTGS